jgi:hypothetical protein
MIKEKSIDDLAKEIGYTLENPSGFFDAEERHNPDGSLIYDGTAVYVSEKNEYADAYFVFHLLVSAGKMNNPEKIFWEKMEYCAINGCRFGGPSPAFDSQDAAEQYPERGACDCCEEYSSVEVRSFKMVKEEKVYLS